MGVQLRLALGVFCSVYERFCMGATLWAMLSVRYNLLTEAYGRV